MGTLMAGSGRAWRRSRSLTSVSLGGVRPCPQQGTCPHGPAIAGLTGLAGQEVVQLGKSGERIPPSEQEIAGYDKVIGTKDSRKVEPRPQGRGALHVPTAGDFRRLQYQLVAHHTLPPDGSLARTARQMDDVDVLEVQRQRETPQRGR